MWTRFKKKTKKRSAAKKRQPAVRNQRSSTYFQDYLRHLLREASLIFSLAACIFLTIALLSYHYTDPAWSHHSSNRIVENAAGRVGAWFSDFLLYLFGYWAYLFPMMLALIAWQSYKMPVELPQKTAPRQALLLMRLIGFIMCVCFGCGIFSLMIPADVAALPFQSGGIVGSLMVGLLINSFNTLGTLLILSALMLSGLTLFVSISWFAVVEAVGRCSIRMFNGLCSLIRKLNRVRWFRSNLAVIKPPSAGSRIEAVKKSVQREIKPKIIAPQSAVNMAEQMTAQMRVQGTGQQSLPPLQLLRSPKVSGKTVVDKARLESMSQDVEQRLADFGVNAQVVAVHPGPVVTRYELQLAAGTKVSKISNLAKDLARSLSVISVRVVEVIPGKSVIGLELPNPSREMVVLQEVLVSTAYQNARSALTVALGKDIAGHPVVVDLAKMPHLLVAGTTGSGKSVGLNAMLLSLLYKSTPEELRLILIDPKMLELSVYDGIPHLLTPVVTDMKDASTALRWCVVEMERRYRLMAALGVRNISGFNQKIKEAIKAGEPICDPLLQHINSAQKTHLTVLPQIVVLADEFADMMVVVGKKVETLIARLAQKARAAGIHLILATQRPSVDVITGLIKANIPTRIAFQVSSKVDSRTILDQQGAEQLLGHGDMLYLPPGSGVPVRVHGAFVEDQEVHRVVAAIKKSGQTNYLDDVLSTDLGVSAGFAVEGSGLSEDSNEKDALFDQAVDAIARSRRVSISSIQRRFKIGYNRAARIVEEMEAEGIVSRSDNNGPREVLVPPPQDQ